MSAVTSTLPAEQPQGALRVVIVNSDEIWWCGCFVVATATHLSNGTYQFETPITILQWTPDQEKRFKAVMVGVFGADFYTA